MAESVEQNHSGPGDNVAGNKYIFSSVRPDAFEAHINEILVKIRHENVTQAKSLLKTLQSTSNLDSDTFKTLELIQIFIALEVGDVPPNSVSTLNNYVSSDITAKYKDIAFAALLKLDVLKGNSVLASERFASIDNPGERLKEAYFTLAADIDAVSTEYTKTKLHGSEGVLCGLVRGAIRLNEYKLALSIATQLCELYENLNSRILKFTCQNCILRQELDGKPYWLIDANAKAKVDAHIEYLANLFEEGRGRESRLNEFSNMLVPYQMSNQTCLIQVCNRFASEIETDHLELFSLLDKLQGRFTPEENSVDDKLSKAKSDESYRENLTTQIMQLKEISLEDSYLLRSLASEKSLRDWLKDGGKVFASNPFKMAFSQLELMVLSNPSNSNERSNFSESLEHSIVSYQAEFALVYPARLLNFCEKLIEIGFPLSAVKVLRPLMPSDDIWLSPLVNCYINALLKGEQFKSLSDFLNQVQKKWWTPWLWQIQARLHAQMDKLPEAISALEDAIKLSPCYPGLWVWLINLNQDFFKENFHAQDIFLRIPAEVFNQPSDEGYHLLAEFVRYGLQDIAEEKIVSWFINDPVGTAESVTNFYFSVFLKKEIELGKAAQIGNCLGGYKYEIDNKTYFKLIVEQPHPLNIHLLSVGTPLGMHLMEMRTGEANMFGAQDIQLIEKLPTMVAIFRLASHIREDKNDGTDCFYSFTVPNNPDELLPFLERKLLGAFQSESPGYLNNPSIPVYFKGKKFGEVNPIAAAVKSFTDKRVVSQSPPTFGLTNSTSIVLDPYSLCYLALANLAFEFTNIFQNIIITKDTQCCVLEWLKDINRDDFLSIAPLPGGGIRRTKAEDIRRATAAIQRSLLHLLNSATPTTHKLVDYPSEFAKVDEHVDQVTSSSYKLALANNFPWFCLDPVLARLFEVSGGKVVNVHDCIIQLSENMPAERIDGILLFASMGFPFVVTYKKLYELICSDFEFSHYVVADIIKKNHGCMSSYNDALEFTYHVITKAIKTVVRKLRSNYMAGKLTTTNIAFFARLFNTCCYEIMQYDRHVEAELKLATLLYEILLDTREEDESYKLFLVSTCEFISGHFLNFSRISDHISNFMKANN